MTPQISIQKSGKAVKGAQMRNFAKRAGMLILLGIIVVLGLVSAAAASAVWGG
jgi:hypothetical protein